MTKRTANREYRGEWLEAYVRRRIASQVRALRGELSQAEFEARIGKSQTQISRLEDPAGVPPTLTTLLEIARKLDIALIVEFTTFGEALKRANDSTPDSLAPASYEVEQKGLHAVPAHSEQKLVTSKRFRSVDETQSGRLLCLTT